MPNSFGCMGDGWCRDFRAHRSKLNQNILTRWGSCVSSHGVIICTHTFQPRRVTYMCHQKWAPRKTIQYIFSAKQVHLSSLLDLYCGIVRHRSFVMSLCLGPSTEVANRTCELNQGDVMATCDFLRAVSVSAIRCTAHAVVLRSS